MDADMGTRDTVVNCEVPEAQLQTVKLPFRSALIQDMDGDSDMDTNDEEQSWDVPDVQPQVEISVTNADELEDNFYSMLALVPDPVKTGIKRRESDEPRNNSVQDLKAMPPTKVAMVDEEAAKDILDDEGYYIQTEAEKLETARKMEALVSASNSLLPVPNFNPTPAGSPRKTPVKRYSLSPHKSEFTGQGFAITVSPKKRLEF